MVEADPSIALARLRVTCTLELMKPRACAVTELSD